PRASTLVSPDAPRPAPAALPPRRLRLCACRRTHRPCPAPVPARDPPEDGTLARVPSARRRGAAGLSTPSVSFPSTPLPPRELRAGRERYRLRCRSRATGALPRLDLCPWNLPRGRRGLPNPLLPPCFSSGHQITPGRRAEGKTSTRREAR